jgi:hypothetical protein
MVFGAHPHCAPSQKLHQERTNCAKPPVESFEQLMVGWSSLFAFEAKLPEFCTHCSPIGAAKQGAFATSPVQNSRVLQRSA